MRVNTILAKDRGKAVVDMTAAAERSNITQPTLTKRLQKLEAIYGCKLVERMPRGVRLTALGEELLPFAARIEQTHLQAGKALGAIQNGYLEDIRIGAGPLFHLRYHAGAFEQLREDFPRTRIHVITDLNDRNIPRIRDG